MGCDGGTIPRRDELVRTKKKPEQKDKSSELTFLWQHCTITQQPLRAPIVACGLGRLYNKDAVLEGLLDRSALPAIAQHISSLKDVKDLKLTVNPAFKGSAEKGDAYIDTHMSPYRCPVIGLEMNGKFRFAFLWSCGCVVSERALKEVKSTLCHKCQQAFTEQDIVILNGSDDDLDLMTTRMEARQARVKAQKKERNDAKRKAKAEATVTSSQVASSQVASSSQDTEASGSSEKPTSVQETKLAVKPIGKLLKRGANVGIDDPLFKKTKDAYSIAKDPKATDVFKSLFTSHQSASDQTRAHWVTYNPFYN